MSDTTGGSASTAPQKTLRDHLNDEKTRAVLYQLLAAFAVIALFTYMVSNVTDNLDYGPGIKSREHLFAQSIRYKLSPINTLTGTGL